MAAAFDPRIVRVTIDINGSIQEYTNVRIDARGNKLFSAELTTAEIRIYNLSRENQNWIITTANPFAVSPARLTPIKVTLEVGRESYGTFTLFQGGVYAAGITQPPDMGVILQSMTSNPTLQASEAISSPQTTTIGAIAAQFAKDFGYTLNLRTKNPLRQIVNFCSNGTPIKRLKRLNEMGIVASINNNILNITDPGQTISDNITQINSATGLVGVPQAAPWGCSATVMVGQGIDIGAKVQITSTENPSVNGVYLVNAMGFEVSNREQPFFFTLDCHNIAYYPHQQ
jgi:hypothetical protein